MATDEWRDIEVPGCWTMQGTSDLPHYTNVQMPFGDQPPDVPEENPTGLYERHFVLPARGWAEGRVVLHIGAAESVVIVTLNGSHVGVSKDSHLAAELDITSFVRQGENTLSLRVVKWSDATHIEDQDQWWHGGITRSVYLYRTARVYVADISVQAGLADDMRTGTLDLDVQLRCGWGELEDGWTIEARLDGLEEPLSSEAARFELPYWPRIPGERALVRRHEVGGPDGVASEMPRWEALRKRLEPAPAGSASWTVTVPGVEAWSAETPHLRDLRVTLRSPTGDEVEEFKVRVGFRRVEVRGVDLLVNGRRVYIRGVNRHDFDQHTGRVVSRSSMRDDLVAMKRFGFNAVRTSHYPNDPAFLDLTDELGMYVVDEADIESHAFQATLCDDPRYLGQWLARVSRMVLRDRNHASVILWSLGNESGYGSNHDAAAAWVRRHDRSRPLHYEAAIRFDWAADPGATDVTCPMYPEIGAIVEHARALAATEDAVVVREGELPLPPIGPGRDGWVDLPRWEPLGASAGVERWLTFRFETRAAQSWSEEGLEICWDQLRLDDGAGAAPELELDADASVTLDEAGLLLHPLLASSPRLSLWRAPTDNDRIAGLADAWAAAGIDPPGAPPPERGLRRVHRDRA